MDEQDGRHSYRENNPVTGRHESTESDVELVRHFGGKSIPMHIMNLPESLRFHQGIIHRPNADQERLKRIMERNPAGKRPA